MIELQDSGGRLVVVLPMRLRHGGNRACVFVDGRLVGEYGTFGEAARHARSLAEVRCPGPQEAPIDPAEG